MEGREGGREEVKKGVGGGKTNEERRERTRDVVSLPTLSWLCWYIV